MKKEIKNIKLGFAMLFACALLCFTIVFLLSSCKDNEDIPVYNEKEYIEIEDITGLNIYKAKELLAEKGIAFEIAEDKDAKRGFVSKLAFSGEKTGSLLKIEKGTTVTVHSNTEGLNGHVAHITIDDGPTRNNTSAILDVLEKYDAKATFFLLGEKVASSYSDELCKKMVDEGHLIGCHSYSHELSYVYSSPENMLSEIERFENVLKEKLGEDTVENMKKVFRFPGGSKQNGYVYGEEAEGYISAVKGAGYEVYDWNCLTGDGELRKWDKANESEEEYNDYAVSFMKNMFLESLGRVEESGEPIILLAHDKWTASDKTLTLNGVQFFEWVVKTLYDKGYVLDTL